LAVAAVTARLCMRGGVRLGRSARWRLPRWPRFRPWAGGCGWDGRPVGGCRGGRAFVRARGGAVWPVGHSAVAAVAACLCVRGGVLFGRSASWQLPLWRRNCPCVRGCGWGGRLVGSCRGCCAFLLARGGAVGAVGQLEVAAVAAWLSVRGGADLGRLSCWRLPYWRHVCPCPKENVWGGWPVGRCRGSRVIVRARGFRLGRSSGWRLGL